MAMPMMDIRIMRMAMRDGLVAMRMAVRFAAVPICIVFVLMMRVVHMPMAMLQHFMRMLVRMPLGEMQPYAQGHQGGCQPELP